jgi:hypothetical protein
MPKATFEQWMAKVDAVLVRTCGLTSGDLADWMYGDAYDDGVSPREAAQEVLAENGWVGA